MQLQLNEYGIFEFDPTQIQKTMNEQTPKGYVYYFPPETPVLKHTSKIPLTRYTAFGISFYIYHPLNPLTIKIVHPELENPDQFSFTETTYRLGTLMGNQVVIHVLEEKWEMIPGFWSIQIWNAHQLLLEKEFEIFVTEAETPEEENYFYDL